jgi:hypothetical protein
LGFKRLEKGANSMNRARAAIWVTVAFMLVGSSEAEAQGESGAAVLERFRALAGEWEGSFEWSGARQGGGKMNASYSVTGNGSAIVETLTVDGTPSMTSVYHADGSALRMTHFCAAGNQPRLKATRIDDGGNRVEFSLVDVTNLPAPSAPHVQGFEIRFPTAERLGLTFTFTSEAGLSYERIELIRVP